MARRLGNISRETIPLLILFVAQQKPSRGGLWHPILMQFYSGPLMQLLSGVDILSFLYFLAFLIVYRDPSKHPRLSAAERKYIRAGGATPEGPAQPRAARSRCLAISCSIGRYGGSPSAAQSIARRS